MKKLRSLFFLFICLGCTSKAPVPPINIALTNNNQSLKITGLDNAILQDIARDTSNHFENLMPVYRMPADTDMKDFQPTQPGKYVVESNAVVFTPDTAFVKKQVYFIRYYQYDGGSVWDFVKRSRSATKLRHIDLIFKQ